jgi:predicted permease
MASLREWITRLWGTLRPKRDDSDPEQELRLHLDLAAEEALRSGHAPNQARQAARIHVGGVAQALDALRDQRGLPWLHDLARDVRFGLRLLLRSRVSTVVAATSLALAIGANTTVFSVAKQLLYERLAVHDASNLRLLTWTASRDRVPAAGFSYPVYEQLRAHTQVLGDLLAFHVTAVNAAVEDDAQRVLAHEVSGNYYAILGVDPQLGRAIVPADDTAASPPVAVISDEFWEREFGRSPTVLGRWMRLNDVPVMIVGVNPKTFTGAASTLPSQTPAVTVALAKATIVTPSSDGRNWLADPLAPAVSILGRAGAGVNDGTAQAILDTQFSAIVRATLPVRAGEDIPRLVLRDGSRGLFGQRHIFATPMSVLMIFLGLVLLLACANIANLMLARGAQRQHEMSVRLALGAGRGRIFRQMLVESLVLAAIGGTSGLAIGYFGRTAIPRLTENAWELATFPVHFDWQVFAFTAAVTIFTGVLFGVAPALAATRAEVTDGLKKNRRTATGPRKGLVGKAVVGFQIALSTLLVIGAGLFIRSLAGLNAVDPGFRTDHLLLAQIVLPQNRYAAGANVAFHQRMEQAIATIPGVVSVSPAEVPYLSDELLETSFLPQGEANDPDRRQSESYNAVGRHFFETLGIPIVAGRAFGVGDTATSPKVGIINQRLATARFPKQNPIGKRFSVGVSGGYGDVLTSRAIEIIGVCADTLYADLIGARPPQFFIPYVQQTQIRRLTYQIRTGVQPEAIVPALRRVVHTADPELPLVNVRTQREQIDSDLQDERLFVTLTSVFGMLALVLASVGVYGVTAYSVARRTNEIAIRLALGAIPRQVVAMVLREASWLSAVGIATGVGASFLLSRLAKSLLFGIAPYDPATLWGAALLLATVALGASWIPASRAARVQPIEALKRD